MGYRSLGNLRKVNFEDRKAFTEFMVKRMSILSESYTVIPISKIVFSYIHQDGLANDTRLLFNDPVYEVTTHVFNNMMLSLTMDPANFGEILSKNVTIIDEKKCNKIYSSKYQ